MDIAFNYSIAPKEFHLWGVADSTLRFSEGDISRFCAANHKSCGYLYEFASKDLKKTTPSDDQTRTIDLGRFYFNITEENVYKNFPIDNSVRLWDMKFQRVIFSFKNNWGSDDYTCIYRVGVYGHF